MGTAYEDGHPAVSVQVHSACILSQAVTRQGRREQATIREGNQGAPAETRQIAMVHRSMLRDRHHCCQDRICSGETYGKAAERRKSRHRIPSRTQEHRTVFQAIGHAAVDGIGRVVRFRIEKQVSHRRSFPHWRIRS